MRPPQPDLSRAPLGGTIVPGGAQFRLWAPRANGVWILGSFNEWRKDDNSLMDRVDGDHWVGYVDGAKDGDEYMFFVDGRGTSDQKRDPRARKLTVAPAFPDCCCLLRDPSRFPWISSPFRPPAFRDLIVYELHVGAFSQAAGHTHGRFFDLIRRVPHLAGLGVNAIELMPIQEYPSEFSLGYNGVDYYSPENDYGEYGEAALQSYFQSTNNVLQRRGSPGYANVDMLRGSDNQLRALVDVCHVYGMAVLLDIVYNHAGGGFGDKSMWFLDRMPGSDPIDSLYFNRNEWAGGQGFDYGAQEVSNFLRDNAQFFLDEYRVDGFRFDEVSVMDRFGGWGTAQTITDRLRQHRPEAITIAEYWPVNDWVVKDSGAGGAGFDATWHDGIRRSVRGAVEQAARGASAFVDMESVAAAIENSGLRDRWRAVQSIEDHDIVRLGHELRVAKLADSSDPRSWYGRSRVRVATGLLATAPGIPMLFMGQEFFEWDQWNDTPGSGSQLQWGRVDSGDKQTADHIRFTSELMALRRRQPALRGEGCHVIHCSNENRVLAFQRWVVWEGRDVVVVASLNETTWFGYQIGFPSGGRWLEVFNSDVYENWVNPDVYANGGSVEANGGPFHGLPASAFVTIPANGLVVFARE